MDQMNIQRRQILRILGAGALFGTVGTGVASAGEGRYIVGTATREATREATRRARSVHRVLDFGPVGNAVAGTYDRHALGELSRRSDVRYVEPDGLMHAIEGVGDIEGTDAEVPWGVDRVDAEKVHATYTGAGGDLAIIDTGIDNDHPDLQSNLGDGISFTVGPWWRDDSSTDPKDWDDGNGHGTHCAGIAAAVDDGAGVVGVAPSATLHAVRVLDNSGSGSWSDVAAGIQWTADQGYHVGSLSLGGGHSDTGEDACTYAAGKGVLLVAAAGNDGPGTADDHYPAAYPTVVSVGATERDDDLASFSSTGSTVELGAPGRSIYSTYKGGGYKTLSGTSMACPHVSGAGAILMSTAVAQSSTGARDTLATAAEWPIVDSTGTQLTATEIGHGLLDVEAAVGGSGGETGDATAPSIGNATATDDTDADGTVGDGDQVTVAADVSDADGLSSVTADASDFGASSTLAMTDDDADGTFTATFLVDATAASADGEYPVTITATDTTGTTATADTNALTLTTGAGDGGSLTIDEFTVTSLSPNNPHAEVEMTWQVSGSTGVTLQLYEGETADGTPVGEWPDVGASGTRTHTEKHASPRTYTAKLIATDGATTVSRKTTVTA